MSDESVIRSLELTGEALKYHLLAEAIRRGAKIRPQGYHHLFFAGKSCAMGSLIEGMGGKYGESYCAHWTIWPSGLSAIKITDLNDDKRWTREAIADRLDDVAYGRIAEF